MNSGSITALIVYGVFVALVGVATSAVFGRVVGWVTLAALTAAFLCAGFLSYAIK